MTTSRVAPVVSAVAVLAGLALLSTLAMVRPDPAPRHVAAALVGPDGARTVLSLADGDGAEEGAVLTLETARQPGGAALQGGPEEFLGVFDSAGESALGTAWVRETQQRRRAGGATSTEALRSLDTEGLRTWIEVDRDGAGQDATRVFDPPALTLPADVAAGARWSSSGTVTDPGVEDGPAVDYLVQAEATAAADGCLDVASSLRVGEQDAISAVRTWCPGRGVVAQQLPGEAWTPTERPVAGLLGGPALDTAAPSPDWQPAGWALEPVPWQRAGAPNPVVTVRPPTLVDDDTPVLSLSSGGDVVALTTSGDGLTRLWTAHPGGVVTTQAGLGRLTVVGTTRRELVAYDDTGLPRWSLGLDDVVTRPLLALDPTTLVAADQSGDVTAVDLAGGDVRWQQSLAGDVVVAPVRCGDLVLAGDATDRITAVVAGTGERRWSTTMPESIELLACDRTTVLVVDSEGDLHALAATDGSERWTSVRTDLVHQVQVAGEVAVLRSGPDVVALRTADAAPAWTADGPVTTLSGASDRLVLVGPDRVQVTDLGGVVQVSLPDPPDPGAGEVLVSPGRRGLWLTGGDGVPTWVGP